MGVSFLFRSLKPVVRVKDRQADSFVCADRQFLSQLFVHVAGLLHKIVHFATKRRDLLVVWTILKVPSRIFDSFVVLGLFDKTHLFITGSCRQAARGI